MSKPEDIRIPADVEPEAWRAAAEAMGSVGWFSTSMIRGAYIAIMAAKAEEREACASVAEGRHRIWGTLNQIQDIEVEDDISACLEIAAAIRKRREG